MDAHRRPLPLRRVATMAALAALTLPAGQAAAATTKAKAPVITSVSPMRADVGDVLTLRGKNFRKGKGRNSVGFKRDGAAVVFVKSDISTTRLMKARIRARLEAYMATAGPTRLPTVFRLRVLPSRFGAAFTPARRSPTIGPKPAAAPTGNAAPSTQPVDPLAPVAAPVAAPAAATEADCDGDKIPNGADADDDNDRLPDTLENAIGTDGCKADSDGDGIEDGYEYRSAVDLNDDEYQSPNTVLPYPGKRPYPNPLDASDGGTDHDGDGLSMRAEYTLWKYT